MALKPWPDEKAMAKSVRSENLRRFTRKALKYGLAGAGALGAAAGGGYLLKRHLDKKRQAENEYMGY